MGYLTVVRLNLWYIGFEVEKHLDYLTGLWLILLYIGLGLIKWINQAGMRLQEYDEDILQLSLKQLVIKSSLISLGQMTFDVWKT